MEKCLLAEIDFLDDDKGCYATNKYLSERFDVSEGRMANAISKLRQEGWIVDRSFNGRTRRISVKAEFTENVNPDFTEPVKAAFTETVNSHIVEVPSEIPLTQPAAKAALSRKKKPTQELIDRAVEHKKFISIWRAAFLEHKKVEYTVQKHDWKAVETLFSADGVGPQGFVDIAIDAWTHPEFGWHCASLNSLWHFAKQFNFIKVQLKERKDASQRSNKPRTDGNAGTFNEGRASQYRGSGKTVPVQDPQRSDAPIDA